VSFSQPVLARRGQFRPGNKPNRRQFTDQVAAELPAPHDRSGWPPHASERRDFYHRIRVFPREVAAWRKRMLRHLLDNPARFPEAASASPEEIQARLDDGISYLRKVAHILAALYGTPDLGNTPDPTDELVYIILARHTREGA
jgi:DNA (cytosine-5)-methyltransferase 1